jgi:rubrerythrin
VLSLRSRGFPAVRLWRRGSFTVAHVLGLKTMATDGTQEVFKVLTACRALELAMAGLYESLALLHEYDPAIARLWKKTAREEMNHAAQFTMMLETMADTISAAIVDASTMTNVRQAIEATIEEFQIHPPSVREALVAAIDFEESMTELHADQVLIFANPQCKRLFQAMMAADNSHVGALRAVLTKLPPTR